MGFKTRLQAVKGLLDDRGALFAALIISLIFICGATFGAMTVSKGILTLGSKSNGVGYEGKIVAWDGQTGGSANTTTFQKSTGTQTADRTIPWPIDAPADGDVWTYHTGPLSSWDTPLSAAYATIQEEGGALTQRLILNFIGGGFTAADDGGGSRTNLTLDTDLSTFAALNSLGYGYRNAAGNWVQGNVSGGGDLITGLNSTTGDTTISLPNYTDVFTLHVTDGNVAAASLLAGEEQGQVYGMVDTGAADPIQFSVIMPANYVAGSNLTISAWGQTRFTSAGTALYFTVAAGAAAVGDNNGITFGTPATSTLTAAAASGGQHKHELFTFSAITPANTPQPNKEMVLKFARDSSNAADNYDGAFRFAGLRVRYTTAGGTSK